MSHDYGSFYLLTHVRAQPALEPHCVKAFGGTGLRARASLITSMASRNVKVAVVTHARHAHSDHKKGSKA